MPLSSTRLTAREKEILRLVRQGIDVLMERKPMGRAPEPQPRSTRALLVIRRSA